MKKLLVIILVLTLLLVGLFLWKGGHHALFLTDKIEDWLDAGESSQSLTVMLQKPGIIIDEIGQVKPEVHQIILNANTFWTGYADRPLFGMTVQGITAYTDGAFVYMDTGKAYTLPDLSELRSSARKLVLGMLLHGRVTKKDGIYHISMKHKDMELSADITIDKEVQAVTAIAVLPDDTAVQVFLTVLAPEAHPIPQPVADAMVRAQMEPPVSILEPLELLIPAFERLLPLEGSLKLGVSCGILELSETVGITVRDGTAVIDRGGSADELALPGELKGLPPAAAALLMLRDGEFSGTGTDTEFSMVLPGDLTAGLLESLVPQAAGLGITLDDCRLTLHIRSGSLRAASLSADGSVPFLFTTIPVAFSADLSIS